jgi:hypothetical protein
LVDFLDCKLGSNNRNKNKKKNYIYCNDNDNNKYVVTLFVKNVDSDIQLVLDKLKLTCIDDLTICDKIFIIDMGSEDDTQKIIHRISEQDEFIEVFTALEKEHIFENFESLSR